MRELADVDLRGQVAADRALERLSRLEVAARQRPAPGERVAGALPEQHPEHSVADLEDDGERSVSRSGAGRLAREFSLHSRKH